MAIVGAGGFGRVVLEHAEIRSLAHVWGEFGLTVQLQFIMKSI